MGGSTAQMGHRDMGRGGSKIAKYGERIQLIPLAEFPEFFTTCKYVNSQKYILF